MNRFSGRSDLRPAAGHEKGKRGTVTSVPIHGGTLVTVPLRLGMVEGGGGPGLAEEALAGILVPRHLRGKELEGDAAAERRILGQKDLAHAALTDLVDDAISPERLPDLVPHPCRDIILSIFGRQRPVSGVNFRRPSGGRAWCGRRPKPGWPSGGSASGRKHRQPVVCPTINASLGRCLPADPETATKPLGLLIYFFEFFAQPQHVDQT